MWSKFANLKDNLTAIAADVLETREELEAEGNGNEGSPKLYPTGDRNRWEDPDIQWYKDEVNRLRGVETDIEEMSKKFVNSLREKEEEAHLLKRQNEYLKKQLTVEAQGGRRVVSEESHELEELREKAKALQAELSSNIVKHQEKVTTMQDSHRRRTDVLFSKHKRDIEGLQNEIKSKNGLEESHKAVNGHSTGDTAVQEQVKDLELKLEAVLEKDKEHTQHLVEKDQAYGKLKDAFERSMLEVGELKEALERERGALSEANMQLERDHGAVEGAMRECNLLKSERQRMVAEMIEVQKRADEQSALKNVAEKQLQQALGEHRVQVAQLQAEKDVFEVNLRECRAANEMLKAERDNSVELTRSEEQYNAIKARADSLAEEVKRMADALRTTEEMVELQKSQLAAEIATANGDREKAVRDLARLKQHLLEIEMAESEKMERDFEKLEDLEKRARVGEERVFLLEEALSRAQAEAAEANLRAEKVMAGTDDELGQLRTEVVSCQAALEAKDIELNNLQIALGQYYAESEAQERLHGELASAREALARMGEELRNAKTMVMTREEEKEKALSKISFMEQNISEGQQKIQKYQEEVAMLRRALEQSMIRINRMSTDSDFYVDRRIVIKLLITYFQKNHSREVLDLMARMLGFSEEEKQRVGLAQQGGQGGVMRGMLGFSGRLVGGLLKGVAQETEPTLPPDENMSFGDLWIDFLLKESEERERREKADLARKQMMGPSSNPIPASPKTPRGSGLSSSPPPPSFYSSLSPRSSPSKPYVLTPRTPRSPVRSPSLSGMPEMYTPLIVREESQRESLANGFGSSNATLSNLAQSPISASNANYMSGGDFSPVPLNASTLKTNALPYGLSQSRSLPYPS